MTAPRTHETIAGAQRRNDDSDHRPMRESDSEMDDIEIGTETAVAEDDANVDDDAEIDDDADEDENEEAADTAAEGSDPRKSVDDVAGSDTLDDDPSATAGLAKYVDDEEAPHSEGMTGGK